MNKEDQHHMREAADRIPNQSQAVTKKSEYLNIAQKLTLQQIAKNLNSLDDNHCHLKGAIVHFTMAQFLLLEQNGRSSTKLYNQYADKIKEIYVEFGGDEIVWSEKVPRIKD